MVRGLLLDEDLLDEFEVLVLEDDDVVEGFGEVEEVGAG